jgi:hypothetical protein
MTLVISSEAQPQTFQGFVPSDLPGCGGEPVGVQ